MKPVAIIQARMGSTRLPGKVMKRLCDDTVLGYVITRCQQSRKLHGILVATSNLPADDCVAEFAALRNIPIFRGSENDVLSRYIEAAKTVEADVVVRITADCPVIAPEVIDKVIILYENQNPDYAFIDGYPNGLGAAEVLSLAALERASDQIDTDEGYHREHVMTYLLENHEKFRLAIERAESGSIDPVGGVFFGRDREFYLLERHLRTRHLSLICGTEIGRASCRERV